MGLPQEESPTHYGRKGMPPGTCIYTNQNNVRWVLGEKSPKAGCTIRMDFRNKFLLGVQFLVRLVFYLIFVSASRSDTSQKRIDVLVYWPDIKTHCQNHYHQEPEPTTQTWLKWVKSAAWGHQPKNLFHQDASLNQIFEIVKLQPHTTDFHLILIRTWSLVSVLLSPFSWQAQNLCGLSLAFILDWRVVVTF